MRVAVIFFGMARGVRRTIDSIQRNIYACNQERGLSLTVIASLNLVDTVSNPRTGEHKAALGPDQPYLLDADAYTLVRQDDASIATALKAAQIQGDHFQNNWISVRNTLHQLASLRRGWEFCANVLHTSFDAYLFLRPDLIYLEPVRLAKMLASFRDVGTIAIPPWHCYWGFNDRFALADAAAARHYANRLALVDEYCLQQPLHPEAFLSYALAKGNCRVCALPVTAQRVRANDTVKTEDFDDYVLDIPAEPSRFSLASGRISFAPAVSTDATPLSVRRVIVDGFERVSPLGGLQYLEFLQSLHLERQVKRYLEIGTQHGESLMLARGRAVAIDPHFLLKKWLWFWRRRIRLFETTSDEYFSAHDPRAALGGPIELAFIDGMHLSEYVLRDFINVEQHCSQNSLIVLHDALPQNFEMTERQRRTEARHDTSMAQAWTGDVWRVVPMLRRERPDLRIEVFDCPPTGLVLVTNLDPLSRTLQGRLDQLTYELTASTPSESEFWSFIESLTVLSSRATPPPAVPTSIRPAGSARR